MVKQRHQLFVTLLCISDGLVIAVAAFLAWVIRRHLVETWLPREWESFVKGPFFLFVVPITLVTLWLMGLYRARRDRSLWSEQGEVFKAAFISLAAILIVLWAIGEELISGEKSTATKIFFNRSAIVVVCMAAVLLSARRAASPRLRKSEHFLSRVALRSARTDAIMAHPFASRARE